jgi:glycosyltransferase 2 family protein
MTSNLRHPERSEGSGRGRQLFSLAISLVFLGVLYWTLDLRGLGRVFAQAHPGLLAVSVLAILPIKLLQAWRLKRLVPRPAAFPYRFALRLIFLADVMNIVLPSKTGDLAKSWFMKGRGELSGSLALSLVVFEKACDVLALLAWCAVGLLWLPEKSQPMQLLTWGVLGALAAGLLALGSRGFARLLFSSARALLPRRFEERAVRLAAAWQEVREHFRTQPRRAAEIALLSLLLWWVQFQQVWLFILAVRAWTPPLANLALAPLAILAGLVPLTFAGLGTRDAALIALYRPWLAAPAAAAVGLLTTTRYVVPALLGLPLFRHSLELAPEEPVDGDQEDPST